MSERKLSVGQLAAAELIVSSVVTGVAKFSKQLDAWYDLVTAVDKLGHLVELPTDRSDGAPLPATDRRPLGLEFVDVEYRYEDAPPTVQGVHLQVAPGARVAVVGMGEVVGEGPGRCKRELAMPSPTAGFAAVRHAVTLHA